MYIRLSSDQYSDRTYIHQLYIISIEKNRVLPNLIILTLDYVQKVKLTALLRIFGCRYVKLGFEQSKVLLFYS